MKKKVDKEVTTREIRLGISRSMEDINWFFDKLESIKIDGKRYFKADGTLNFGHDLSTGDVCLVYKK